MNTNVAMSAQNFLDTTSQCHTTSCFYLVTNEELCLGSNTFTVH
jgi:hypothetical protein